jgi:hypothetical protein
MQSLPVQTAIGVFSFVFLFPDDTRLHAMVAKEHNAAKPQPKTKEPRLDAN